MTKQSSGNGKPDSKNINVDIMRTTDNINEYINIIKSNIFPILIIFLASILVTILYVINATDIYKSTTTLKISRPSGSILTAQLIPEFQDFQNDRFISNEIQVMKSRTITETVARALIDSFNNHSDKSDIFYILCKSPDERNEIAPLNTIVRRMYSNVGITQKRGLDIVDIDVESPSALEAQMMANVYASCYLDYSLNFSRREVTSIRKFLEEEKQKRIIDLNNSEASLQDFQQKGGIMFLDEQAKNLVNQITSFEAAKNAAEVDVLSLERALSEVKDEIEKVDKSLISYLDGEISQPYIVELQKKIAEIEIKRDIEASIPSEEKLILKTKEEYNKKLDPLKKSFDEKVLVLKSSIYANTPADRRQLIQKYFETNISLQSNRAKFNSLKKLLSKYESEFSKLPAQSIELAKLERVKKSAEKLYLTLEEKYQEALVNERAQLGNVNIIDKALVPQFPTKPNRKLIIIAGCILGLALGLGFAFLRNYLDRSIKTPEEIEKRGISVLAWIPNIEELKELGSSMLEFVVANKPNSTASESFKALRTRVLYSKLESEPLKTILITSSIPSEGKTTVALNLAGSFAQAEKNVLLLDCDLRKPRVHAVFETERFPGLSDYLFGNFTLEEITRKTKIERMNFITSGTIPPNPSELLGSKQMKDFMDKLRTIYDMIIIDSSPFLSVTDSEIIMRLIDGCILIVQANKTPIDAFLKGYTRMVSNDPHKFLGSVFNNFSYKSVYGYYYNYYYYYSRPDQTKVKKNIPK